MIPYYPYQSGIKRIVDNNISYWLRPKEHIPKPDPVQLCFEFYKGFGWTKFIPMIRRVVPGLISSELVGVQPMMEPLGLIFAPMRYEKSSAWINQQLSFDFE